MEHVYDFHIREVSEHTTAVIRCQAHLSQLSTVVPDGCGEVMNFIRAHGITGHGRAIAYYLECDADMNLEVEIGFEVAEPFQGDQRVVVSHLPAGRVATVTYMGPYEGIPALHVALRQWCEKNGHGHTEVCWEIYGHWTENPAELQTDIFYLLK